MPHLGLLLALPQDVDECETEVCPGENEQCENTEGSYRCVCAEGYTRNEGICVKEQIPGEPHPGPQKPGEVSSPRERASKPLLQAVTGPVPPPHPPFPHEATLSPEAYIWSSEWLLVASHL